MKYYRMKYCSEQDVVGVSTGLNQCYLDKSCFYTMNDFNNFREFYSLITYQQNTNALPDFNLRLKFVKIYSRAKITDFLRFEFFNFWIDFVVNENVKKIFEDLQVEKIHFFETRIMHKNKISESLYYLMHMDFYDLECIDLKNSIFVSKDVETERLSILPSKNFEEFWNSYNRHKYTSYFSKLCVFKNQITNPHFIRIRGQDIHISEILKNIIEEKKISGIEIYDAPYFNLV